MDLSTKAEYLRILIWQEGFQELSINNGEVFISEQEDDILSELFDEVMKQVISTDLRDKLKTEQLMMLQYRILHELKERCVISPIHERVRLATEDSLYEFYIVSKGV